LSAPHRDRPALFVHLVEDLVLTALLDEPVVAEALVQRQVGEEGDDRDQAGDGHVVALADDLEDVLPPLPALVEEPRAEPRHEEDEDDDVQPGVPTHGAHPRKHLRARQGAARPSRSGWPLTPKRTAPRPSPLELETKAVYPGAHGKRG